MVVCQKCGYDNELGRIFCHSCGAKLNLSEIKPQNQGGKSLAKKPVGSSMGKIIARAINVVILVAIIAAFYLAAQVPPVRPISSANEDLVSADKKRMQLDDLSVQKQPQTITVSEAELNSFVGNLGFEKGNGGFLELVPTQLQIELGDGVATAIFLGKIHLGGSIDKQIYLSYTGVPTIEGGHFVFKPVAGALGTLPISGWILEKTGALDRYYAKVFASMGHEKDVLDSLSSISVTAKEAVLNYQPH
jgi:hypothetical protein